MNDMNLYTRNDGEFERLLKVVELSVIIYEWNLDKTNDQKPPSVEESLFVTRI